jgi:hypothetical protein
MSGMPMTRIDDILIHPRDGDLIIGTHGRGIFILDDITALQQLSANKVTDKDVHLFEVRPGTIWFNDTRLNRYVGGSKLYRGTNPVPGTAITYYLKSAPSGDVKITISDYTGTVVRSIPGTKDVGLNGIQWNLRGDPPPRPAGGGGGGLVWRRRRRWSGGSGERRIRWPLQHQVAARSWYLSVKVS